MTDASTSAPDEPLPWPGSILSFIGWLWVYAVVAGLATTAIADLIGRCTATVLPSEGTRLVSGGALALVAGIAGERVLHALAGRSVHRPRR